MDSLVHSLSRKLMFHDRWWPTIALKALKASSHRSLALLILIVTLSKWFQIMAQTPYWSLSKFPPNAKRVCFHLTPNIKLGLTSSQNSRRVPLDYHSSLLKRYHSVNLALPLMFDTMQLGQEANEGIDLPLVLGAVAAAVFVIIVILVVIFGVPSVRQRVFPHRHREKFVPSSGIY